MPTVVISMKEGLDRAGKKALIENVTNAVSDTTGIRKEAVTIIIDEKSTDNFGNGGVQLTEALEARAKSEVDNLLK